MVKSNIFIPPELLVPLNVNGLKGRMLRLAPPKNRKREVLLIYGHHASLERFYSLAQVVNDEAGVTMPDLPGFGGMDSFYSIGEKAHIDTMADYLATIVKLRYKKDQRFTIAGVSYGFTVVTRMLLRYPEIAAQVDMVISIVGFAHHEDLQFSPGRHNFYKFLGRTFKHRFPSMLFHSVVLNPTTLRLFYSRTHNAKLKFIDLNDDEYKFMTEFEIQLWRINEARTYGCTTESMFTLNNCIGRVNLPVWHIYVKDDNYFNNDRVEQHMRQIFTDYHAIAAPVKNHMPNVIAGKEETSSLFPPKILSLLRKYP